METRTLSSLSECCAQCQHTPYCQVADYDEVLGTCRFLKEPTGYSYKADSVIIISRDNHY